jgi:hypothetical protein
MKDPPVAKIAAPPLPTPSFPLPEPKLPKLDLEALFAAQKTNLAVAHQAQGVLADAAQAIARVQHGYVERVTTDARAALGGKQPRTPEAVLTETKAAAERAFAVTEGVVGLAVAAQRRVVELVTGRAQANADELKAALAA